MFCINTRDAIIIAPSSCVKMIIIEWMNYVKVEEKTVF